MRDVLAIGIQEAAIDDFEHRLFHRLRPVNNFRSGKSDGAYEATGIASNAQAAPLKGLHTSIMCKKGETWMCVGARSIVR
jgi:hypothetical protein